MITIKVYQQHVIQVLDELQEIIYFLDSDDFIESYCISVLVKAAKIYINVDMVYGSSFSSRDYLPENILNRADLDEFYDNRKQIKI